MGLGKLASFRLTTWLFRLVMILWLDFAFATLRTPANLLTASNISVWEFTAEVDFSMSGGAGIH